MTRALVIAWLSAAALVDGPAVVTGQVVSDDTGEAVANTRVRIAAAGRSTLLVSDAEGRFTISPSTFPLTIAAVKSGYVRREITVRDAQASVELRLARAAVISGRVVNRLGDPVVDARVSAERPGTANGASPIVVSTQSDDAGEFRLAGLAAGSFVVAVTTMSVAGQRAAEPGVVHYDSQLSKTFYPEADTVDDAETIAVAAGERHPNVDIVVSATQVGGVPFSFSLGVRGNAPQPLSDQSAAISGHVTTPDGRPLTRAIVRLLGASAPAPDQSTTTDPDGRYSFEGLSAGTYRVAASKSGYAPLNRSDVVIPQLPMLGAGPSVKLGDDQKREDVDVTLAHLGSVSGFVFDEIGEPIQGATIQLLRVRFERGRRRLVPAGVETRSTDDRGHYRVFGVEPGQYLVAASVGALMVFGGGTTDLPGYAPTYFPGTTDPRMAQFVGVAAAQDVAAIDVSLTPSETALVSGTIVTAAGEPTMAGTLQLRQLVGASASPVPMNAKTRPDGVFAFENVPPGSYLIYADRGRTNPSTEGEFTTQPVTVTGDDVTGLKLQMSSGSSIAGRITFDSVDPDSRPDASRVEISPIPVDVDRSPGTPANAGITREWTFQMRGINGVRRLLAPHLPAGWALREVRVNGVDATDRPLAFGRREQSLTDVEVVLTDRVAVAAGHVTDADGRPVPGALVLAFAVDRDQRFPWSRFVQHTTSAGDGTYTLASIPAGSYYIAAVTALPLEGDDAWQDAAFLESLAPSASMLTVSDGERRTIDLRVR